MGILEAGSSLMEKMIGAEDPLTLYALVLSLGNALSFLEPPDDQIVSKNNSRFMKVSRL